MKETRGSIKQCEKRDDKKQFRAFKKENYRDAHIPLVHVYVCMFNIK